MNLENKKIGIWGYGVVGKSILNFLITKYKDFLVVDKNPFSVDAIDFFKQNNIEFLNQNADLEYFLNECDVIFPSPGIDMRMYQNFAHKFVTELDLFASHFKKEIIAITGSVGKTTVTDLIAQILKSSGKNFIAAGNIGFAMCDLLENQKQIDGVVLELSSFQLEQCKQFAPSIAIWTNFFANHLDMHGSIEQYFNAKIKIVSLQNDEQICILPMQQCYEFEKINIKSKINYISNTRPLKADLQNLNFENIYYIDQEHIVKLDKNNNETRIIAVDKLSDITYKQNWVIIYALLDLKSIDYLINDNLKIPEHRMEKFYTTKSIEFYNDSKSTVPDATLAAVSKFKSQNIVLFLGGVSKGVDRFFMFSRLKGAVKFIICFGKEAEELKKYCQLNNIEAQSFTNLEESVVYCSQIIKEGDKVIFSPAGASFDLFANYQERGNKFKELIKKQMS